MDEEKLAHSAESHNVNEMSKVQGSVLIKDSDEDEDKVEKFE